IKSTSNTRNFYENYVIYKYYFDTKQMFFVKQELL
ncbi:hypothetical protein QEI_1478, partial [Clostridioides difficile CD129]